MKKNYLFIIVLFLSYSLGYGQTNGDFRSKTTGPLIWSDAASWEYYNGGWVNATTVPEYPGQNIGAKTVTIQTGHIITIPSNLSTLSMGNVTINGTLILGDGTSNQHITTLPTKLLTINSTGTLKFSGPKVRLILPASDAVLIIEPSGKIDGSCTNNDEIFVNINKYATCVGSGSKTYSFGDIIAAGGTFNAEITIPTADPSYLAEVCNILLLEGINTGSTTGIVSYLWNLVDTDITTGSFTTTNISTITTASFTPVLQHEYLVTFQVSDDFNTNVHSLIVTALDITPPVTPTLADVNGGQCGGTPTAPTTTDVCAGTITGTPATIFPITTQGTTVVTWTFNDGNGNSTTANQNVIVDDTFAPVTPTLANVNVGQCGGTPPTPTTTDVCAGTISGTTATIFPITTQGTTVVTWTFNDGNGNSTTANQNVIVDDTVAPVTPILADVNVGQCGGTPPTPTTTDVCAGTTTGTTATIFPITTQGTTIVTWTFNDGNGNSTTANQNVIVDDTAKPTLTTIANRNENVGASCSFTIPDYRSLTTAADNCTVAGSIIKTQLPAIGTVISGNNTTQLITITANDGNGNTETTTFTVTLKDVTPPVTPTLTDVNVGQCSGTPTTPTTTDICAGTITGTTTTSFPITAQGTTVVTWTFADGNGNSTTANQNVIVDDTVKPTLTTIANRNENVGASCSFTIPDYRSLTTAADNCTVAGSIIKTQLPAIGTVISGHNTTQLITITANDGNGNKETTTFTVTLKDVTPPVTPTLADVNVGQCSGTPTAPTTTDICAGTITGTTTTSFPITAQGTTVVTWTFADGNGNSTTANQNVIVDDTINPTLTTISNRNEHIVSACSFTIPDYTALTAAADNCNAVGSIVKTQSPVSGTVISGHNTTQLIIITANDGNGNIETTTFTVTLKDVTPPVTPTLADVNVGQCSGTPTAPTTTDICAGTITGTTTTSFPITAQGTTVVTWTFADGNGNSTTANQNVIVDDTAKPTLTTIANRNENVGASCSFTIPDYRSLTAAADNCTFAGSIVKTQSPVSGTVISGHNTTQLITITANDGNGNIGTTTFTITLKDVTPPVTLTLVAVNVGQCNGTPTAPTTTDVCAGTITGTTSTVFPITAQGTTIVTWTFNDNNGQSVTATQNVTVDDTINPTLTTISNRNENIVSACSFTIPDYTALTTAADNCTAVGSIVKTQSPVSGTVISGHNTTQLITITANDGNGNIGTTTFTITLKDVTIPTITAPANINTFTNISCTATSVILGTPITSDNCTVASVTNNAPAIFPIGNTTVTWTVTDSSNRIATATQIVTVTDNINPTLTQGSNQSANTATGSCTASVDIVNAGFSDNCSDSSIAYTLSGATVKALTAGQVGTYIFNKGVTIITYTVSDGATPANTFSGIKTVTVTDTIKPVAPALLTINAQCSITVPYPMGTDNCDGPITATTSDNRTFSSQGNFSIIWSFKDNSNNETIATQNVVIKDTTAPVPSIGSLTTLPISNCSIDSLTPPTATDNCKGLVTGTTTTPLPITTVGTTVIIWTYNDGNGNSSSQNQSVILTKPAISGGSLLGNVTGLTPAATPSENIAINSCPDDVNPITMNLSGQIGTIIHWEKFEAGNTAWSVITNTTNSYNIVFNYANTKSTLFRVLVQVGNCTQYSNMVNIHAVPPDVKPRLDKSLFNICLNESVSLVARSGYTSTLNVDNGGDFNTGQFPQHMDPTQWRIDDQVAGSQWTANADATKPQNWSGTNDHPFGTLYSINYDSNQLKFGMAHGDYNSAEYISRFGVGPTTLETPLFSLVGLKTAAIAFDQAYNLHAGDICKLELLIFAANGTTLQNTIVLQNLIGTSPRALSWGDTHGAPVPYPYVAPGTNGKPVTDFDFKNDNSSFDLSDYIGNSNVRVKWTFFGTTDESAWAIDNITIPVKPYFDDVEWTDGLGNPGEYIIRNKLEATYTFVPTAPGVHQYGATSLINGCRAYDASGTALATVIVNYAYAGTAQAYTQAECGEKTVKLNAYDNTKSADVNKANGAYPLATNSFSNDPGTGAAGKWSVFSGPTTCTLPVFSDVNSPTSTFTGDAGLYTLRWTLTTSGCFSDVQVTLTDCNVVDFDGVNDYVDFNNNYELGNAFSIEVWVKPDPQPASPPSNLQSIISKRSANSLIDGYDLRLIGSTLSFNWNNGSQLTSPFLLTTNRWYHIAVTYSGGAYKLYVDGIEVNSTTGTAPTINSQKCILGAMDQSGSPPNKPLNYFSGWIDELRIWNVGLSPHHIRQMMNQQVINNSLAVRGEIIPIDINGPDADQNGVDDQPITWANLNGYYRMDNIACSYLKPHGGKGVDGKLRNINSIEEQTAPLPYTSIRDGNWIDKTATTPWKYGNTVWDFPNSTGYNGTPIDWNIVQTSHNINSGDKDITVLGLISTAGKLTIADPVATTPIEKNYGQSLWITHYLKLNGSIDLVGESQLLEKRHGIYNSSELFITSQFSESILDVSSIGFIKRDQQGKKNSFNYNYWSSPVSVITNPGVSNNMPYIIKNVIKDGTNSAVPQTINFGTAYNFADDTTISNPIKLTDRWIWSYNFPIVQGDEWANYYQWYHITSNGALKVGEAFTMKGTGGNAPITATQNYSFIGKPNSGTINLNLAKDNSYLVGNPYPSALDADEFIKDNLKDCSGCRASVNSFSGALYFWDHFGISENHILAEYEGGYATYTLMGGVVAINNSPLNLNDGDDGENIPKRYIPIGQGFFIDGYLDEKVTGLEILTVVQGGPIVFQNNQRAFKRESVPSSVFMKKRGPNKTITEAKPKIRLGFVSSIGAHRQLLVGADSNTTTLFDIGYDAPMFDTNENDMFWDISDSQFVIQGVPDFNTDRIIPVGLVVANEGEVTIKIDELENVSSSTKIYLHDNVTGIYHDLKNSDFKISLAIGEYNKRFALKFESQSLGTIENDLNDGIMVMYSRNYKTLIIKNDDLDRTVNSVNLFNMLGQAISNWNVDDEEQTNIQIPIKNMPSGIYIVKVKTTKGESSKKIIIN